MATCLRCSRRFIQYYYPPILTHWDRYVEKMHSDITGQPPPDTSYYNSYYPTINIPNIYEVHCLLVGIILHFTNSSRWYRCRSLCTFEKLHKYLATLNRILNFNIWYFDISVSYQNVFQWKRVTMYFWCSVIFYDLFLIIIHIYYMYDQINRCNLFNILIETRKFVILISI